MTNDVSRRSFIGGAGALCIGVSFGVPLASCGGDLKKSRISKADSTGALEANMYITILASGRVKLTVSKAEIGQGVNTGYATLVAEELDVNLDQIDCEHADSLPEFRLPAPGVRFVKIHFTGGSTSMMMGWKPLRVAAATARHMLVGAAAKQWGVPAPDCQSALGEVIHQSSGRKLGYGELTKAAARMNPPANPRLKKPSEFRVIGKRQTRHDGVAKVTGQAVYGIDVKVEGMVRAAVMHAPVYGAKPKSIDADAAKAMPGVIDVFGFFAGVAVVADKYWQAQAAARKVIVEWKKGKTEGLDTEKMAAAARAYKKSGAVIRKTGNGSAKGAGTIEAIYEAPHLAHAPLEPQNCTAKVTGSKAELWAPCQIPTVIQEAVADAIGIDASDVLVHTTFSGGGFGRRGLADFATQAAAIAKHVKRPVQMIWSRESDMSQGYYRPASTAFFRGNVKDGRAHSLTYHSISHPITLDQVEGARGGMASFIPRAVRQVMATSVVGAVAANSSIDMFAHEGASNTPYRIPNSRFEYTPLRTGMPVSFWRSVGHSFNAFFMESFVDELANTAKADPYQFRRQMLEPGSRELRVLDAVAEFANWKNAVVPAGHALGIARHSSFESEVAEVAEVAIVGGRIRVKRVWCVVDCGMAINPDVVAAQMEGAIIYGLGAALDQKITLVDGVVQQGNFDDYRSLRMFESPEIKVKIIDSDDSPTGVGEPGLPPIAPAVSNAVFALTGARLRKMPLQDAFAEQKGMAR